MRVYIYLNQLLSGIRQTMQNCGHQIKGNKWDEPYDHPSLLCGGTLIDHGRGRTNQAEHKQSYGAEKTEASLGRVATICGDTESRQPQKEF